MKTYCFDTHALYFWVTGQHVTPQFQEFFDRELDRNRLWVSSICFWELALLVKKGRLEMENIVAWKEQVCQNSAIPVIDPTANNMISSTLLPAIHKDPFDRILIAQALNHNAVLVTRDTIFTQYSVPTFWM